MEFLATILREKAEEVSRMPLESLRPLTVRPSFYEQLRNQPQRMHVIGEIKRASPSKGVINGSVDILTQAKAYEKAGVSGISVLTDPVFFKGSIADLAEISRVVGVPLLCKDFIISEKQLIRARNAGASMVLLIIAALPFAQLKELYQMAKSLKLEVLVETHDATELEVAHRLGARIIGVNNRDLTTFEVDLQTSIDLSPQQSDVVYISESGFETGADVARIKRDYQGVLVGETLMRAENVPQKLQELQVKRG